MPAALAVELTGDPAAEAVLDELRASTGLVERTARGDHRIHPLLRSYLVADLARQEPAAHRQLHATAARWWSGQGQPVHALRHAERAGDDQLTAALLRRTGVRLLLAGDLGPLRRALAAVGPDARARDPWLALTAALIHLDERALEPAAAELDDARRSWPRAPPPALPDPAHQRRAARRRPRDSPRAATPAPAANPAERRPGDGRAAEPQPRRHRVRQALRPRHPAARTHLERARALAEENDLGYLEVQSLSMLSTLAGMRGDLRGMVAAAGGRRAATRIGRHPSAWSAGPAGMLAYADLLVGDPEQAAARSGAALESWETLPPEARLHAARRARRRRRRPGPARGGAGRDARGARRTRRRPVPAPVLAGLALLEHRLALQNGNRSAAAEVAAWLRPGWAHRRDAAPGRLDRGGRRPVRGRGSGRRTGAPAGDDEPAPRDRRRGAPRRRRGGPAAGGRAGRAARRSRPRCGRPQPLGVAPALRHWPAPAPGTCCAPGPPAPGPGPSPADVAAACAAVVSGPAALLSEREQAVLALLPSLLNAREIADEFTVSVNTIKSHIRSIYAKLGVSSRREAVRVAQERGLLR